MAGLNDIISLGKRALLAQQLGMQITSNNISNAQNPDYSRQSVQFSNDQFVQDGNLFIGMGVNVDTIRRIRNQFYDDQVRQEKAELSKWDSQSKYAQLIEGVFDDISGTGLSEMLDSFWNGWLDLSNNPGDRGARQALRTNSQQLINTFHSIDEQLRSIAGSAKDELLSGIKEVNDITRQIANLNKQIASQSDGSGGNNTLMDQRDALIEQLSNYMDIKVQYHDSGSVTITGNYQVLVDQNKSFQFGLESENVDGHEKLSVVLYGDRKIEIANGKFKGLLSTYNDQVFAYIDQLDDLAANLVEQVNAAHQNLYNANGETGINFFSTTGTKGSSIQLSNEIQADLSNIAASSNQQAGDGSGAIDIANIRDAKIMNENKDTINGAFRSVIAQVGDQGKIANQNLENNQSTVNMLKNQRQAVMGVSLEEEMANMIVFQQAFSAASKIISVADEMMQTVMDMV